MNNSNTPITDDSIPSASALKQLAESLTQWRGMLPKELQWPEDNPAAFPSPQPPPVPPFGQSVDPSLSPQPPVQGPLFTEDLDKEPVHYLFVYDIQIALLRSRYYYAKYIVHRPYVYKALHFPDQMSQLDAEGAAECLRVSPSLPFALSQMLIFIQGLHQVASNTLTNFEAETNGPVYVLLVTKLYGHSPHFPYDGTQPHAEGYKETSLWPKIRIRVQRKHQTNARLDPGFKGQRPDCDVVLEDPSEYLPPRSIVKAVYL